MVTKCFCCNSGLGRMITVSGGVTVCEHCWKEILADVGLKDHSTTQQGVTLFEEDLCEGIR